MARRQKRFSSCPLWWWLVQVKATVGPNPQTGSVSWVCSLYSHIGPLTSKEPGLGFMLCCFCLEILHTFWTRGPAFFVCTEPCKLRSWACLWMWWNGSNMMTPDAGPLAARAESQPPAPSYLPHLAGLWGRAEAWPAGCCCFWAGELSNFVRAPEISSEPTRGMGE